MKCRWGKCDEEKVIDDEDGCEENFMGLVARLLRFAHHSQSTLVECSGWQRQEWSAGDGDDYNISLYCFYFSKTNCRLLFDVFSLLLNIAAHHSCVWLMSTCSFSKERERMLHYVDGRLFFVVKILILYPSYTYAVSTLFINLLQKCVIA